LRSRNIFIKRAKKSRTVSHQIIELIVYFLTKGTAAYVFPRFDNKPYRLIERGDVFGHIDFAIKEDMVSFELSKAKRLKRKNIVRRFTVLGMENSELLILTMDELEKMRLEFPEHYVDLFDGANNKLQKELLLKFEIVKKEEEKNPSLTTKVQVHGLILPLKTEKN
jgi:hypothetical protein